jgi:hypothetical protein
VVAISALLTALHDDEPYLTTEESSEFLRGLGLQRAPSTLKKLRCVGGGPTFVKYGRFPRYTPKWLQEYAQSQVSAPLHSTSEASPQKKTPPTNAGAKPANGAETGTPDEPRKVGVRMRASPPSRQRRCLSPKKGRQNARTGADFER